MKRVLIIVSIVIIALLTACSNSNNSNKELSNKEIIGYTSRNTPIIKEENNISWNSTPDSTCFSSIGYDEDNNCLYVIFRETGAEYKYSDFTTSDWIDFTEADSLGSYFNKYIKGNYYCEKIEE